MKIRSIFLEEMPDFHSEPGQRKLEKFIGLCSNYEDQRLLKRTNLYAYIDRKKDKINFKNPTNSGSNPFKDLTIVRDVLKTITYDEQFHKNKILGLILAIDELSYHQIIKVVVNARYFNSLFCQLPLGQREHSFKVEKSHKDIYDSTSIPSLYSLCLHFFHTNLCETKLIGVDYSIKNFENTSLAIKCLPVPNQIKSDLKTLHYSCPNKSCIKGYAKHGEQHFTHFIVQNSPFEKLINLKGTKYEGRSTFTSLEKTLLFFLLKYQRPDLFEKDGRGIYIHNPYRIASISWGKMYRPVCPKIIPRYLTLSIQSQGLDSDKLL